MGDRTIKALASSAHSRREFLGASLLGIAAIYSASALTIMASSSSPAEAGSHAVIRDADARYFGAMLPAIIVQANTMQARVSFLESFNQMLTPASLHSLKAIQGLVDLLTSPVTRPFMTMSWLDWNEMDAAQLNGVLESWRDSSIELRRVAYALTTTLVRTAWYMQPDAQLISGYSGSPKKIVERQARGMRGVRED